MALTKVSYAMIEGAAFNVLDFGADNTGSTSSVAAFNAAVANGGTVYIPSGTYKLDSKVTLDQDGTTLWLAADVTLLLSGVPAVQTPFGNQIDIRANNCAVIGSGPSSLLQIADASQANALGIVHKAGLTVRDLVIDGAKSTVTGISDDTFESAISIIADTGSGATTDVNATVDNCEIRNFVQYGVNIYGNQANGVKVVNCNIHDIGKAGDALSVGAGIVITRNVSDLTIANNVIKNCKFHGIFASSAGEDGANYTIVGNECHQNGGSGIAFLEQSDYGSVNGKGLYNIAIGNNVCTGNTRSGIIFSASDSGFLRYFSISGNVCEGNSYAGIELLSSNTSPNIVSDGVLSGNNCVGNTVAQIGIGQYTQRIDGVQMSFTPVVQGTTTAGTGTYIAQDGFYVKNGSIVNFELNVVWSAHTGTGDIRISGFPYPADTGEPQSSGWVFANGLTITGQAAFGLTGGQTYGGLAAVNNGTVSPVAIDTAATLRINGFYFTNS